MSALAKKLSIALSVALVLGTRLGNNKNYSYARSVLRALLFLSSICPHAPSGHISHARHAEFLQRLVSRSNQVTTHLWAHPVWLALMQGWGDV